MTQGYEPGAHPPTQGSRPEIDAGRLWVSGIVTGLVASLANIVALLVADRVLDVDVLVPEQIGSAVLEELTIPLVVVASFVPAILATGLLHLLLGFVPRPRMFFFWIGVLVLLGSLVAPFTAPLPLSQQVALAVMHVLAGIIIISVLSGVSRSVSNAV